MTADADFEGEMFIHFRQSQVADVGIRVAALGASEIESGGASLQAQNQA